MYLIVSETTRVNLVVGLVALLIGLSKGGIGNALGSLATPILTLVLTGESAIGLALPLLLTGDIFAVISHRGRWNWPLVQRTLLPTFIGVVGGSALLGILLTRPTIIEKLIGLFSLLFVIYKCNEVRIRRWFGRESRTADPNAIPNTISNALWPDSVRDDVVLPQATRRFERRTTRLFSFATGLVSTLANAGGPVFSVYLLTLDLQQTAFAATQAIYFGLLNTMKIPTFIGAGILCADEILRFAWVIPLVFIGVRIGVWADHRIDKVTFERVTLLALIIVSLFLLLK